MLNATLHCIQNLQDAEHVSAFISSFLLRRNKILPASPQVLTIVDGGDEDLDSTWAGPLVAGFREPLQCVEH